MVLQSLGSILAGFIGKLIAPFLIYKKGRSDERARQNERKVKATMEEAERHINGPRTTHDTINFLRERAKRKRRKR